MEGVLFGSENSFEVISCMGRLFFCRRFFNFCKLQAMVNLFHNSVILDKFHGHPTETSRRSWHYGTEGFKGGPHYAARCRFLVQLISFSILSVQNITDIKFTCFF